MFCRHCGQENASNAVRCIRCGEAMTPEIASPRPTAGDSAPPPAPAAPPINPDGSPVSTENHMIWAIVSTIAAYVVCCFSCFVLPACVTGIVAIVFASQVNTKLAAEDYAGAAAAARNAKIWCWVTTGFVLLGILTFFAMLAMGGLGAYMEQMEQVRGRIGS